MASLISFLKSTVLTVSDSLNAKTSGALQQTETGIQAVEDIFTKLFSSLLNSGNGNTVPPITTLTLTPEENTQVDFDQAIVSTVVNPTEVLLTRAPYTFATAPANTTTSISTTQPNDISHTPVGTEPPPGSPGVYPYVKTFKTESGNMWEVDDTPGQERLFIYHKSGTYQEIIASGRNVSKVVGDNFKIIVQDDNIYIEGSQNLYVKGNMSITCLNDVNLNVGGRVEMNVAEDFKVKAKSISLETTSGDINIYSANSLNTQSAANTSMYARSSMNLLTADSMSVAALKNIVMGATQKITMKSQALIAMDSIQIATNMGLSAPVADSKKVIVTKKTGLGPAPTRENTTAPSIVESIIQGADDDGALASKAIDDAVKAGRITKEEADKLKTAPSSSGPNDTTKAGAIKPGGNTQGIENLPETAISGTLKLSEHYTLSHLTAPGPVFDYQIRSQGGRSKQRIAANLALLAQNVLEPINKKWGPIQINSAFRYGDGKSQHDTGMAVDITYGDRSSDPVKMLEIAKWIRDNVAFDQLILEYGKSQIWTHVSFNGEGTQRGDIRTCPNPTAATYPSGLQPLGWTKS